METYIAILRGINVSGQKLIRMQDLKKLFEALGLQQVSTYIQSGNVVFRTACTETKALAAAIEKQIADHYAFQVPVIVRSQAELTAALKRNPFLQLSQVEADKLHLTFLADPAAPENVEQVVSQDFSPDLCAIFDKEVFLYCPQGYGKTKLNNTFFEKKLGVKATTRNLKTVRQLISLAENATLLKP